MDQPIPAEKLIADLPAASSPQGMVDRKELAFIAVERTRMPMVVVDPRQPDAPIVLANQAFLDLTGYSAEEMIGRNCRFLQGPDTDRASVDKIRKAIAERHEITVELLNYRKDGSAFWNQLFISPVLDDDGQLLYFFASQMDVTERRRARDLELAEHWLLREVDHRAKNALALVQGIVRLSRQHDPLEYARSVQGRVDSLARAHSLLSESRWRKVGLSDLLEAEIEPFGHNRVGFGGPVVELKANQVQPLGLLLHEMLANAATHGSLTCSGGTVTVRWDLTPEGAVRLEWQERGGPSPSQERVAGFGSKMIDGIVARQLRGTLSLDWTEEGLDGLLMVPAAA